MGTNYYLQEKPPCDKCGREFERLHIGQSSAGWCFALHVIPELGINNLADWKKRWEEHPSVIRDEYGKIVTWYDMLWVITGRSHPKGLTRHKIGDRRTGCIDHEDGTYDLMTGDFS